MRRSAKSESKCMLTNNMYADKLVTEHLRWDPLNPGNLPCRVIFPCVREVGHRYARHAQIDATR